MSIRTLSLLVGAQVPAAVPREVSDALERVEIDSAIGERGMFRLTFRLDDPALPERFLLDSGDLLRVVLVLNEGHGVSVVMDGVMVVHTISTGVGGNPVLMVSGEDLTLLMDLLEVERPFPATPVNARVQVLLAAYGVLGIVPLVVAPPLPATPVPAERIPHQRGTDYAYIRSLADEVGFRFTLDPGPVPASSVAYWGPEPRADRPRPALSIDFSNLSNIEALQVSFDANQRVVPEAFVLEPASKTVIPIPVPNIAAISPPLGRVVPPAHRHRRLRDTAKLTAAEAASALLAADARSAEAMTGHGTLNVARARVRLRAGAIVEVHGAARPFDGLFEVYRVRDTITPSSHSQAFELVRAGIGAPAPGRRP
ncbi:MAG TPA: hypothetical protein VJN96_03665 [Vicinamibacterales bacterium]|nr:hypothetical protein [Vicinamibacterales bacterium]